MERNVDKKLDSHGKKGRLASEGIWGAFHKEGVESDEPSH